MLVELEDEFEQRASYKDDLRDNARDAYNEEQASIYHEVIRAVLS
jgi:hypothetical protein